LGTSEFGVPTLEALPDAGHEVCAVVTAPPRPSGRGRKLVASPVEAGARKLGLNVLLPPDPNAPEFVAALAALAPDIGVLVAYGYILRQPLLDVPRLGFLNIHPSLLPAYRGAAPIQRTIINGEIETGVSVIKMNRAVDAGDVVEQIRMKIGPDFTTGELTDLLAQAGARLLLDCLPLAESGRLRHTTQDKTRISQAPKISKLDRIVDWSQPAQVINNLIRGLNPEPGATTTFHGRQLVLFRSRLIAGHAAPGELVTTHSGIGVGVGTGSGLLELLELRPEGGKTQSGRDFANGQRLKPGERLGA
jgi:methionyl-tRNA formyltransferase